MTLSDIGCISSKTGTEYMGTVNVTKHNTPCLPWNETDIDVKTDEGGNNCRNPSDNEEEAPYCYVRSNSSPVGQRELCNISYCGKQITPANY